MQNIHELWGSRFPIIQAPMTGVKNNDLAIAVIKAGGLGSLPCGTLVLDATATENNARSRHTALTNIFIGRPARGIVNQAMERLAYINDKAPTFPYASLEMGLLRDSAEQKSSSDFSPLWCGENTAGCDEVSAQVIINRLMGQP